MKTTVTESGASVASPSSIEEALDSGFLPRDPNYLRTGKFAEDKPGADNRAEATETDEEQPIEGEQDPETDPDLEHDQEEPETPGTAADKAGETAAGSQPAEAQKGKETRTREQSESRWAKLSRENRELRDRLSRLEGRHEGAESTRDSSQASHPAAAATGRPEPKIDDVDGQGKPKYADFKAWQDDLRKWDRETGAAEAKQASAKAEQAKAEEIVTREWNNRVQSAAKELPDFKEVALDVTMPIKAGSLVDVFILESSLGPKLLYHFGKNRDELERIQGTPVYDAKGIVTGFKGGLNPIAQARELTKLELKLAGSKAGETGTSSVRPITRAPRPANVVDGKGTVAKDSVSDAVERKSQSDYARAQNERDPRLLAIRKARKA